MQQVYVLKILLWKNYILRSRQLLFLLTELLWPLALFFVLFGVRSNGLATMHSECHFTNRAMPSAGLIPFIQSIMCSGNYSCVSITNQTIGTTHQYTGAGVTDVLNTLYISYSQFTPDRQLQLSQLVANLEEIATLSHIQNQNYSTAVALPLSIADLLSNVSGLQDQISAAQLPISASLVQQLLTIPFSPELIYNKPSTALATLVFLAQVGEASVNGSQMRSLLCQTSFLQTVFALNSSQTATAQSQLCNMTDSQLATLYNIVASNVRLNMTSLLTLVSSRYSQATRSNTTQSVLNVQQQIAAAALNATATVSSLLPLFANVSSALLSMQSRLQFGNDSSNNMSLLSLFFCNYNSFQVTYQTSSLTASQTAMLSLSSLILSSLSQATTTPGALPPDRKTTYCNKLIGIIENSTDPMLALAWNQLKPLVRGKIPYAPDTPITRQLMAMANETFVKAAMILDLANDWLDFSSALQVTMTNPAVQNALAQVVTNCYVQAQLAGQPSSSCTALGNFLSPSSTSLLANVSNTLQFSTGNQSAIDWLNNYVRANNVTDFTLPLPNQMQTLLNTLILNAANGSVSMATAASAYLNSSLNFANQYVTNPQSYLLNSTLLTQLLGQNGTSTYNLFGILTNIDSVATQLSNLVSCFDFEKFLPVADEPTLEMWATALQSQNRLWAAVFFDLNRMKSSGSLTPKPTYLHYKIRMDASKVDTTSRWFDWAYKPGPRANVVSDLNYLQYGFAYLQDMVERAFIELQVNTSLDDGIYLQQFPYPCYLSDSFAQMMPGTLPLFIVLAWIFSAAIIVKNVVYEREQQLKVVMRVMGLRNATHWFAWFISSFVVMFAAMMLLVLIIKFGRILPNTDMSLLIVYLLSYLVATVMLAFLVSQAFKRANVAAVTGGIIFFVTYLPYIFIGIWKGYLSGAVLAAMSIFSNVAVSIGFQYMAELEVTGVGAQWSTISQPPELGNSYSLLYNMLMLWFDSALYLLLLGYIDLLKPIELDGCGKVWYYPFTSAFWCNRLSPSNQSDTQRVSVGKCDAMFDSEPEPSLPVSVQVERLTKVYGPPKKRMPVLNGLTLALYDGQISALLGHNGAGKSTFLSVLTGLTPATSGHVNIYGLDLGSQPAAVRKLIGFCPQHNVLFDLLTVEEHILFYGRLKGMPESALRDEVTRLARATRLSHKLHALSKTLSGGMKRKLSIAIAFIGDYSRSKQDDSSSSSAASANGPSNRHRLIILDEPTAGVDPHARRAIWDLIVHFKRDNTILFTTHHMDEADILSDRIFIVSRGMLCSVGSNAFLKRNFGSGYYLTLVKAPEYANTSASVSSSFVADKCESETSSVMPLAVAPAYPNTSCTDPDAEAEDDNSQAKHVLEFLRRFVPATVFVGSSSTELTFLLPTIQHAGNEQGDTSNNCNYDGSSCFAKLFRSLDSSMTELGLTSYGLSDTALEEVFLKVVSESPCVFEDALGKMAMTQRLPAPILSDEALEQGIEQQTDQGRLPQPATRLSFRSNKSGKITIGDKKQKYRSKAKQSKTETDLKGPLETVESTSVSSWSVRQSSSTTSITALNSTIHEDKVVVHTKATVDSKPSLVIPNMHKATGLRLVFLQMHAVFVKRWIHLKRSKIGWVAEVLQPVLFVMLALIFSHFTPSTSISQPPLELQPWLLDPPPNVNDGRLRFAYSNDNYSYPLANRLEQLLLNSSSHYGTRCMNPSINTLSGYPCSPDLVPTFGIGVLTTSDIVTAQQYEATFGSALSAPSVLLSLRNTAPLNSTADALQLPSCSCSDTSQIFLPPVASQTWTTWLNTLLANYDYVQQLTGHNMSLYLVQTNSLYESLLYGAFSFGVTNPLAFAPLYASSTLPQLASTAFAYVPVGSQTLSASLMNQVTSALLPLPAVIGLPPNSGVSAANVTVYMQSKLNRIYSELSNLFAAAYTANNEKVWFNNKGYVSSVSYMNALNNLRLRAYVQSAIQVANSLLNSTGNASAVAQLVGVSSLSLSDFGITVVNHPLNFTVQQYAVQALSASQADMAVAVSLIFALAFLPSSFVMYLISDRMSKSKLLQFLTGLPPIVYWTTNFLWDYANYLLSATLIFLLFPIFGATTYTSSQTFSVLMVVLIVYGFAAIPLLYPFSFCFSVPSTAFVICSCANLFLGSLTTLATVLLDSFSYAQLTAVNDVLKLIFPIFPQYCLGRAAIEISLVTISNQILQTINNPAYPLRSAWAWDSAGKFVVYLLLEGILFCIITIVIQYHRELIRLGRRLLCMSEFSALSADELGANAGEDIDVARERARVFDTETQRDACNVLMNERPQGSTSAVDDVLRLVNLTKVYHLGVDRCKSQRFVAVRGLTIGLQPAECFGLLGVNGAGKTTTFKMLTGDVSVTHGDALLEGHSVRHDLDHIRSTIGYCPQFDALNSQLTGAEHLDFFARIRGIGELDRSRICAALIARLGLTAHAHKLVNKYSGGTKRKLSTAIALLGQPKVLYLDEPTSGMDPKARRFLWNVLRSVLDELRCTVVLTTHSMDECEALCTRLAIMVNGTFKCLGSVTHLKNRYGGGYIVQVRLKHQTVINVSADARRAVLTAITDDLRRFIPAELKDSQNTLLEFHLPSVRSCATTNLQKQYDASLNSNGDDSIEETLSLAEVFERLEQLKAKHEAYIAEYSVCQTSLDHVFIHFAKMQTELRDAGYDDEQFVFPEGESQPQFSNLLKLPVDDTDIARAEKAEDSFSLPSSTSFDNSFVMRDCDV